MVKRRKTGSRRLRRKSLPVVFTDAQLIGDGFKPPVTDDEGNYAEPDVIIPAGREPAEFPQKIECGKHLVVYSSWAEFVDDCDDYEGPDANDTEVLDK